MYCVVEVLVSMIKRDKKTKSTCNVSNRENDRPLSYLEHGITERTYHSAGHFASSNQLEIAIIITVGDGFL